MRLHITLKCLKLQAHCRVTIDLLHIVRRNSEVGSGYYSDIADSLGALQVWPEHRYYAPDTSNTSNCPLLTIEQALVDQVELVLHIQQQYGLASGPVIAIGNSYSKPFLLVHGAISGYLCSPVKTVKDSAQDRTLNQLELAST